MIMNIPNEIYSRLVFEKRKDPDDQNPVRVKEILYEPTPCEDCGKDKAGRKIHSKKIEWPNPHWRHHCLACRKILNPETGEYDLRVGDYNAFSRRFYKNA